MKLTILVDSSLVIITIYSVCLITEKKNMREIHNFQTFYSQITSPWAGVGGHESYIFLSPHPTDAIFHLVWIGS